MKRLILITWLVMGLAAGTTYVAPAADQPNLPTPHDMTILANSDYVLTVFRKNQQGAYINISSNSYAAQFRSAPAPAGILFANFSTVQRWSYDSLTALPIRLLDIKLSRAQSKSLSGKTGLWDLRETSSLGLVWYAISGRVSVRPTVTQ